MRSISYSCQALPYPMNEGQEGSGQLAMNRSKQGRMGRKTVVVLLVGLALASVHLAEAQQANKIAQIGILDSGTSSDRRNTLGRAAFREGLRDLGYVEGKNINIEYRYDEGKSERLPQLAEQLVRLKVDIIVVNNSTAALAAKKSTATIPVVFTTGANPVTTGLVALSPGRAAMSRDLQPIPRS